MKFLDYFPIPQDAYEWASEQGKLHKTRPIKTADGEHFINIIATNEDGLVNGYTMLTIGGKL